MSYYPLVLRIRADSVWGAKNCAGLRRQFLAPLKQGILASHLDAFGAARYSTAGINTNTQ